MQNKEMAVSITDNRIADDTAFPLCGVTLRNGLAACPIRF
jgi:hypothetical protein